MLASAQVCGAWGALSFHLLRDGSPYPRPSLFLIPPPTPIPDAQETSEVAPDGNRAGA